MSIPNLTFGEGLTIGNGITVSLGATGASFTITSSDFAKYGASGVQASGTSGFTVTNGGSTMYTTYYDLHNPQGSIASTIDSAFLAAGAAFNNYGYDGSIWSVTWGAGSTVTNGLVRLAWTDASNRLFISPVDTSDTTYLGGNANSLALAGTFNLPATFTIHTPLIDDVTGWC